MTEGHWSTNFYLGSRRRPRCLGRLVASGRATCKDALRLDIVRSAERRRETAITTDDSIASLASGANRRRHELPFEVVQPGLPAPPAYGAGCFICHRPFDDEVKATREDVVPKWMLKRLGLSSAAANLPSSKVFEYGKRKVPCCLDCNQRMSISLDKPVSDAFAAGCDVVRGLDFTVLFLWLAKIYYGTRYRETGLRAQDHDPDSGPMLERDELQTSTEHLRRCLQFRPGQLSFAAQPGSIFVFRAGKPEDKADRFDYFVPETPPAQLVALRHNDVFVIGIFGDNGYWARRFGKLRIVQAFQEVVLHPVQCDEIMLWFASEAGGAHMSSGCYNLVTVAGKDRTTHARFFPQFSVEPLDPPRGMLNLMRVNTLLRRLNREVSTKELKAIAEAERPPTTLYNAASQELVQATCFERSCTAVFRLAGWRSSGPPCPSCGA